MTWQYSLKMLSEVEGQLPMAPSGGILINPFDVECYSKFGYVHSTGRNDYCPSEQSS